MKHAWGMRNAYEVLVNKLEGKGTLGRPRRKREHNIRIYLRKLECQDVG
jgi:hypothetical protein